MLLGGREVALGAEEVAEVEMGGDLDLVVFWLGGEGLRIAGRGELRQAVGDEGDAEVEPGGGKGGAKLDGLAVEGEGMGEPGEFGKGESEGEVDLRTVSRLLKGAGEVGRSGVVILL